MKPLKVTAKIGEFEFEADGGEVEVLGMFKRFMDVVANDAARISRDAGTHYDRISAYLNDQIAPQTIPEISEATGITRSSVTAVLYRTHKERFICLKEAGSRANKWSNAN